MRARITSAAARLVAVTSLALALAFVSPAQAAADSTDPAAFKQAVQDTFALVLVAQPNDSAAAQGALAVLEAGTGRTQREVIADLEATPPNFADALDRLKALLAALDNPANTSDPAQAQQRLRDVMAMHRYDALHRPQLPVS